MNTNSQILLDKYLAKPLAFMLNFAVRLLGQILRIDHSLENKNFKRIAICKFKGIGSIIQATPMIRALREKFPDAEIIFVSTAGNKSILENIKWIDTLVLVNDKSLLSFITSNCKALLQIIKKRPDVYFDLEIYSDYSTIFSTFSLAKNRIGFYLRSSSFRMGIYTHMMFFNPRVPVSKVYLQLAQLLQCKITNEDLYPLSSNEASNIPLTKPYIVINPNASDLRLERRWGKNSFIQLIKQILSQYPKHQIVLIGSKGEQNYTTEIEKSLSAKQVINTSGKTSLNELIHIIENASAMISNDTGPMHIAFCTNTPVVCLFGPCSPTQYGYSKTATILYKAVYCSPCVHDFEVAPCKGNNVCMQLITVSEVYTAFQNAITENKNSPSDLAESVVFTYKSTTLGKVNR